MREILFRGKALENSCWVEGFYNHIPCGRFLCDEHCIQTIDEDGRIGQLYNVYESTVGQFTGLTDKNGTKIFEGDMLKPFDDEIDKMVVEFHHGSFLLCLYGERGYMGESGWVEEGNYGIIECEPLSSYGGDVEVIGNIHDNPELLEVE